MRNLAHMTMQMSGEPSWRIPEFSLGDRLRKAREVANLSQQELADEIGVSRRSIVRYESAAKAPKSVTLLYAMRTGVPAAWLLTGSVPTSPVGPAGLEPTTPSVKARRSDNVILLATPRPRKLAVAS